MSEAAAVPNKSRQDTFCLTRANIVVRFQLTKLICLQTEILMSLPIWQLLRACSFCENGVQLTWFEVIPHTVSQLCMSLNWWPLYFCKRYICKNWKLFSFLCFCNRVYHFTKNWKLFSFLCFCNRVYHFTFETLCLSGRLYSWIPSSPGSCDTAETGKWKMSVHWQVSCFLSHFRCTYACCDDGLELNTPIRQLWTTETSMKWTSCSLCLFCWPYSSQCPSLGFWYLSLRPFACALTSEYPPCIYFWLENKRTRTPVLMHGKPAVPSAIMSHCLFQSCVCAMVSKRSHHIRQCHDIFFFFNCQMI